MKEPFRINCLRTLLSSTLLSFAILMIAFHPSAEQGYKTDLKSFNSLQPYENNPIIPRGSLVAWDAHIREIGNVLYEPEEPDANKRYKTFYSGYRGHYQEDKVYVGYAYSPDGRKWTKRGRVIASPSEDPYVVNHRGLYYMYYEDKGDIPYRDINLAVSRDGLNWMEYGGNPVLEPKGKGWESQDVSSPVVWIENGIWYMLYEGRGGGYGGKIGLARSSDGRHWKRDENNPVFDVGAKGEWDATNVVCDDIIKVGKVYHMFYHGYDSTTKKWQSGMATSTDLYDWKRYAHNPISSSDTIMVFYDREYIFHKIINGYDGSIGRYYPYYRVESQRRK